MRCAARPKKQGVDVVILINREGACLTAHRGLLYEYAARHMHLVPLETGGCKMPFAGLHIAVCRVGKALPTCSWPRQTLATLHLRVEAP
jgi:hypothetical protein